MFFLSDYLIGILEPGLTHADIGARWAGINAASSGHRRTGPSPKHK